MNLKERMSYFLCRKTRAYLAADRYIDDAYGSEDKELEESTLDDFWAGVEWADRNPAWRPYPEVQPLMSKPLLFLCSNGDYGLGKYPEAFNASSSPVIWWMCLPKNPESAI